MNPDMLARWGEVVRIVDLALDSEPPDRPAVVERLCSGDAVLRGEVDRLLDASARAAEFLSHPAGADAAPLVSWVARQEAQALAVGTRFGVYEVTGLLGRGGMATVYLAQDHKHHRRVAVKVLHAEVAAAVRREWFLREIDTAAGLHHPHILPLHDSGDVDGRLYYVMPHVEGESLRQRLSREGRLPLANARRIAQEVAAALDYAHRQGVVHRDIKPENILLQDGQAIVADFGIARAIDAAGTDRSTDGSGTGTPAYMSPEQASPGADVDGRTDIYALGCVLYKMLAGEPPFSGASAREILARHVADPVPSLLATVRPGVPPSVEAAITKALAKAPVDRFATAQEMSRALTIEDVTAPPNPHRRGRLMLTMGAMLVMLVVGGAATARLWLRPTSAAPRLDPRLVAVLPFRISVPDSALTYLQAGFSDLLAVQFTGEGGPRAVEPRAVWSAWRRLVPVDGGDLRPEAAVQVAEQLGAGRLVDGGIAGSQSHLAVTASVLEVPTGRTIGRASVEGPVDSLGSMVSRLAAELLANDAGQKERLTNLGALPLPALRAYLDGQTALRQGRWEQAVQHFSRALEVDSTFAQAAIGLMAAAGFAPVGDGGRGAALAWANRDRLGPGDRALLTALLGPRYPGVSTMVENLTAAEQSVRALPDRAEAWFHLGDLYYHWGAGVGLSRPHQLAAAAFRRALALDSSIATNSPNAEPLIHLFQLAAIEGDTATVRRLGSAALAAAGASDFYPWRSAWTFQDEASLASLRARFAGMRRSVLQGIVTRSIEDGLPLDDAERAVAALVGRASTREEQTSAQFYRYLLAMNGGRPREGATALREVDEGTRFYHAITGELYWDGDSAVARAAARQRTPDADAPLARAPEARREQLGNICLVERWRLARRELRTAPRTIARLRSPMPPGLDVADSTRAAEFASLCADILEAWLATINGEPTAAALASRLDSRLQQGPPGWTDGDNLTAARLLEANGDVPRALAAVRRRRFDLVPVFLSTYLREEGRLAALANDTAGAVSAYRHYLTLQAHPESALEPRMKHIRAELARLQPRGGN
jgi:eukaryotic-like serine/threonine-protein kinase